MVDLEWRQGPCNLPVRMRVVGPPFFMAFCGCPGNCFSGPASLAAVLLTNVRHWLFFLTVRKALRANIVIGVFL